MFREAGLIHPDDKQWHKFPFGLPLSFPLSIPIGRPCNPFPSHRKMLPKCRRGSLVLPKITYQDVVEPRTCARRGADGWPPLLPHRLAAAGRLYERAQKTRPEKKEKLFRAQYKIVFYVSLRGLFALIILLYNKDVSALGLAVQLRNVLFDIDVVLERPLGGHVIAGE